MVAGVASAAEAAFDVTRGRARGAATGAAGAALVISTSVRPARAIAALAFPAAVWAPFAFSALPAAMRALAALAAAAVPVVLVIFAAVWTVAPPIAAATFRARRDLRRAAVFGWRAPTLAALSSALMASARATVASPSAWPVAILRVFVTRVLAFVRRGALIASRRSA